MINENCFAYRFGECDALNNLYCKSEECSFFKAIDSIKPERANVDKIIFECGALASAESNKKDCEYYHGRSGKHCTATQQETCKYCRFYSPTVTKKAQILADMYLLQKQISQKAMQKMVVLEATQDNIFNDF